MQQSNQVRHRNQRINSLTQFQNRAKVKKIRKFGKVIKSFCKDLGVDKFTFFKALGVELA